MANVVRLKNEYTSARAAADAEVIAAEKRHQPMVQSLADRIAAAEAGIADFCIARRGEIFDKLKSRETPLAVFGFELTPPRVETAARKIKWADVVIRLVRLPWGRAYVRQSDPKPDKEALLADREKLTAEQCIAAGIAFRQDEQFFIRPKPETAQTS